MGLYCCCFLYHPRSTALVSANFSGSRLNMLTVWYLIQTSVDLRSSNVILWLFKHTQLTGITRCTLSLVFTLIYFDLYFSKTPTCFSLRHSSSPPLCQLQLTIGWKCHPSRQSCYHLAERWSTEGPGETEREREMIMTQVVNVTRNSDRGLKDKICFRQSSLMIHTVYSDR